MKSNSVSNTEVEMSNESVSMELHTDNNSEPTTSKHIYSLSSDAAPFIPSFMRNSTNITHFSDTERRAEPLLSKYSENNLSYSNVNSEWTVEGSEDINGKSNICYMNEQPVTRCSQVSTSTSANDERSVKESNNNINSKANEYNFAASASSNSYGVANDVGSINSYTNACIYLSELNPYYTLLHGMNGSEIQYLISMLPYEIQQAYDENVRVLFNSSKQMKEQQLRESDDRESHNVWHSQEMQCNETCDMKQEDAYDNHHTITNVVDGKERIKKPLYTTLQHDRDTEDKNESVLLSAAYKTFQELSEEQLECIDNFFNQVEISRSVAANVVTTSSNMYGSNAYEKHTRGNYHKQRINPNINSYIDNHTSLSNDNINTENCIGSFDKDVNNETGLETDMNSDEEEWLLEQMIGNEVSKNVENSNTLFSNTTIEHR